VALYRSITTIFFAFTMVVAFRNFLGPRRRCAPEAGLGRELEGLFNSLHQIRILSDKKHGPSNPALS
jgi:hypothetical protein